ncbi:DUF6284 family protein [Actinoalloteichus sp. GBA129-24]|uniref:DUF6284 family protein n=1 Tax=Actinoalloteichus sp. GBA129-24 TaxID=1612551 RepID=UPI0009503873|nr:DUF6284 family protein [Actinoalloteichus sp. GBA129-24]APU20129.1 hypothetical protein UA75_10580 [Actinoalloteichus sp. GBA129-24]
MEEDFRLDGIEPTAAELADITAELPLIEAGITVVDAESSWWCDGDELSGRRLVAARSAERELALLVQRRRAVAHTTTAVERTGQVIPLFRQPRRSGSAVAAGDAA